jgi:hypothetical protein
MIAGCTQEEQITDLVPMPTGNQNLQRELIVVLDERGIWYRIVNQSQINIQSKDMYRAGLLFDDILNQRIPRDRSIAPAPHLLDPLMDKAASQGIECKRVNAFEQVWVVCDSEADIRNVNEALVEVSIEYDGTQ